MIRGVCAADRERYISMAESFYASGAACRGIPRRRIEAAFDGMMRSDLYLEGFMLRHGGEPAGCANIAKTFSCEGGGLTVWIGGIFVLPQYRSRGLGRELVCFIEQRFGGRLARLRL